MPTEEIIHIQVEKAAKRLDQYLAQALPELSRSKIQKLIRQEKILLSRSTDKTAQPVRAKESLVLGDVITLYLPSEEADELEAEDVPLDIIYEDQDIVVLNKLAGLVVHPAQGHTTGTLVNALLARYPDLADMRDADEDSANRPGIVHRLDRDTSGLILIARTPEALENLREQFKARTVQKTYLALVYGQPEAEEGIIDVPLGRDLRHRQKMAPRADGKSARTHYQVIEYYGDYSLLEIGLETGRTHQIRVHLAWLKCPVVGDTIYGRKKNKLGLKRQFLHAWKLSFQHPTQPQVLDLLAPIPSNLEHILKQLRQQA